MGAGTAPPDYLKLGPVTQMALFVRKDILNIELTSPISSFDIKETTYKPVHIEKFPFNVDERSIQEKVLDEAKYQISRLRRMERYINFEKRIAQIPLIAVYEFVEEFLNNSSELVAILSKNDILVEGEFIIAEMEEEYDEELNVRYGSMDSLYDFEVGRDQYEDFDDDYYDEGAVGGSDDIEISENLSKLNIEEESWD